MASNKFTGRRYRGSYPPYCIPKPQAGPVIPPGAPGYDLQCFARWTDLDPLAPGDQSAYFPLQKVGATNAYFGSYPTVGDRLEIFCWQIGTTYFWNIAIQIWDPWRTPESYLWPNVWINPGIPFDTRQLEDIHVPELDFRIARVTN